MNAVKKLKAMGVYPCKVKINSIMLTSERLPYFIAECERLGIEYELT